jgi:uncharacterized membrane protein YdfJ with MMPL/SSD domain
VWVVALLLAGFLTTQFLGSALSNEAHFTNDPESARADALIAEGFPGADQQQEFVILRSPSLTVDDPLFREQQAALTGGIVALGPDSVESAIDYATTPSPALVSKDRHAAVTIVTMAGDESAAADNAPAVVDAARAAVNSAGGTGVDFSVLVTGNGTIGNDFGSMAEKDLRTGEIFGVGIALVILVLVFGALVAGLVPLILAVAAIVLALGLTSLVGQAMDLSFFITNMITMIGLAMGIDYSLFVVSRFREERASGRDKIEAITRAASTASRSVTFSAIAVILALGGLFLVPSTLFHSLAMGAILAVFTALLAALTLLPALLGALGDRVNALRLPFLRRAERAATAGGRGNGRRGFWERVGNGVMRRPVLSLVTAVAVLGLLAGFNLAIDLGSAGVDTLPETSEARQGFELLATDFPSEGVSYTQIVIASDADAPAVVGSLQRLEQELKGNHAFGLPAKVDVSPAGGLTLVSIPMVVDGSSQAAISAIHTLRADYLPAAFAGTGLVAGSDILVTGQAASTVDYLDTINGATPWVFLFVLGLSFVLLLVVFRSILVPVKAILMNLLSVGAAYGLMVVVFQKGWGADLLGLQRVDFIEAWVPLFLFAVLFGTSMDYHVFLLSRIRERFDQTADNRESVAFGLRRTGGLITGAALIMVAVFGGFAAGDLVMFQQMGFGLAVAVFLDATVVRCVLVPAAMRLLGARNWWFPRWLHWLPDLRVEAAEPEVSSVPEVHPDAAATGIGLGSQVGERVRSWPATATVTSQRPVTAAESE